MRAGHTPRWLAAAVRVRFLARRAGRQSGVVRSGGVAGEGVEDLAGDGSFEGSKDVIAGPSSC